VERRREPAIDARAGVEGGEKFGMAERAFGAAEKQDAARIEAVVEQRQQLLLQFAASR
jgi:hypothetical protein